MLWESGDGQDVSRVSGGILREGQISLTARNTSSLDQQPVLSGGEGRYCRWGLVPQQEQIITNTMRAILKRLVGRRGVPNYLRAAFQEGQKEFGGRGLQLADLRLIGMLKITIASLSQIFVCLSALGECLPNAYQILNLREIWFGSSQRPRYSLPGGLMSGRYNIQRYFPKVAVIPSNPNPDDIKKIMWR